MQELVAMMQEQQYRARVSTRMCARGGL
jgi:hypothetical protein